MPITRDPDFSPSSAALFQMLNHASDGWGIEDVLQASSNMVMATIETLARQQNMELKSALALTRIVCKGIIDGVHDNLTRVPQPTDIEVKDQ